MARVIVQTIKKKNIFEYFCITKGMSTMLTRTISRWHEYSYIFKKIYFDYLF